MTITHLLDQWSVSSSGSFNLKKNVAKVYWVWDSMVPEMFQHCVWEKCFCCRQESTFCLLTHSYYSLKWQSKNIQNQDQTKKSIQRKRYNIIIYIITLYNFNTNIDEFLRIFLYSMVFIYTGHTQKNGAVLIVFTINTAPFFCVCPVLQIQTL